VIGLNFSYKLRSLIEERNLTQKQVANDLNIAPSTMGGYVQGISEPDFATLKRLAIYFEVTTDYLLNMHTNKTNNFLEDELLRVFRSMTSEQQSLYIEQGKVFVRANNIRKEKTKSS
jgi:HTH-type transcriptional regulator xre